MRQDLLRDRRHVRARHVVRQRAELRLRQRRVEAREILIFGELLAHLEPGVERAGPGATVTPALLDSAVRVLARQFDPAEGGFGSAPKFPPSAGLSLLWFNRVL